jgi:hypothetical protein
VLLIGSLTPAWTAELPDAARPLVRRFEWIAEFAERCEIRLKIYSMQGLTEQACGIFLREFEQADADYHATQDALSAAEEAAKRSGDVAQQRAWREATRRLVRALRRIEAVTEYARFLREAEERTPKPPGQRPKK